MSSDYSENESQEYYNDKILSLKEELAQRDEIINKYTGGFPDFENLHLKLRKESEKRILLETENDKLQNQIKIIQKSRCDIQSQLENERKEHEKNLEDAKNEFIKELKAKDNEKEEIIEVLQKKISECDLSPVVSSFIENVSNTFRQSFESLNEIEDFLAKHYESFGEELEKLCKRSNKKIEKLCNKNTELQTKNRIMSENIANMETEQKKLRDKINFFKRQIRIIDSNAQQQQQILEQDKERLQRNALDLENNIKTLENTCGRLRIEISSCEQKNNLANEKCNDLENQIRKLIKTNTEDADKRINEQKETSQHYNSIIDKLKNEIKESEESKQKMEQKINDYSNTIRELTNDKETAEEDINSIKEDNQELNKRIKELEDKIEELKQTKHKEDSIIVEEPNKDNNKCIKELSSTYESIIESLKENITDLNDSKSKLTSIVLKQSVLINKMSEKLNDYSSNPNSSANKDKSDALVNEMLEWVENYKKFNSDEEIISKIDEFCVGRRKGSLRDTLVSLQDENILSFSALKVISFFHTICELQEKEMQKYKEKNKFMAEELMNLKDKCEDTEKEMNDLKSKAENLEEHNNKNRHLSEQLLNKCEECKQKKVQLKAVIKSLRDELESRLNIQTKMSETLKESKKQLIVLSKKLEERENLNKT